MFDYEQAAEEHGAKLHQNDQGMWCILDQPDSILWWAFFIDRKTAAAAYCHVHHIGPWRLSRQP